MVVLINLVAVLVDKLRDYKVILGAFLILGVPSFISHITQLDSQDTWFWIDISESLRFLFLALYISYLYRKIYFISFSFAMGLKFIGTLQDYELLSQQYDKEIGIMIIFFYCVSAVFLFISIFDNKEKDLYI